MPQPVDSFFTGSLHEIVHHLGMAARIVVAEDDPKQAQLLRLYLEREGHVAVVARDGREVLDLGADDYITKPYSPRELVARVRTVLRRTGGVGE